MKIHMRMSVDGAIRNKAFKGFTDGDGTALSPKYAEAKLRIMQAQGIKYLKVGECDNWSEEEGCLGHKD